MAYSSRSRIGGDHAFLDRADAKHPLRPCSSAYAVISALRRPLEILKPPRTFLAALLVLGSLIAACGDDGEPVGEDATSTGSIDASSSGSDDAMADGEIKRDLMPGPGGDQVTDVVDADGCYDHCMWDQNPASEFPEPLCEVELEVGGMAVEVPECTGSSPDDFAIPSDAEACFWFRRDSDAWGDINDQTWDDIPESCLPANASFAFEERSEGTIASGTVMATCYVGDDLMVTGCVDF